MADTPNHSNICFKCYKAGNSCCDSVKLGILYDEPAYKHFIKAETDKLFPKGHNLRQRYDGKDRNDKDTWDEDAVLYDSNREFCHFFDKETAKCGIYDDRPMICKVFPNVWQNQETIFISLTCPISHTIPLKDIKDWTEPYKDQIAKISYYNGSVIRNEAQYINLRKLYTDYGYKLNILDEDR